jgi:WD40 repeat protein
MHMAVATGPGIQLYEKKNAEWVSDHCCREEWRAVISLAWSPDQKSLVAGDQFGGVHVWDLSGESPQSRGSILPAGNVQRLTFAPDGRSMVVVGSDHQAALWNLEDSVPTRVEWSDFCDSGHLPSYSPDSQLVRVHEHVRDLATVATLPSEAISVMFGFSVDVWPSRKPWGTGNSGRHHVASKHGKDREDAPDFTDYMMRSPAAKTAVYPSAI